MLSFIPVPAVQNALAEPLRTAAPSDTLTLPTATLRAAEDQITALERVVRDMLEFFRAAPVDGALFKLEDEANAALDTLTTVTDTQG
jgi:hypothetical protein